MPEAPIAEELALLRDNVRRFLEREVVPHRDRWRHDGVVEKAAWRKAGEAGFLCISMPEEYGGGGGDFRHEVVIIEELARIGFLDFAIPVHNAIIAPYIAQYGTPEQKRRWLPRMASGELIAAIAMTEPGTGSDLKAVLTRARREGAEYIIDGQKTFITNGQNAGLIIVVAKTDPPAGAKGTSLIVVEGEQDAGFQRGRKLNKVGWHAQDTSELFFDSVRVPADRLLGEENRGFQYLMEKMSQERLVIAVQAVAVMEAAIEETLRYTKERHAFGTRIFDFQNTQFKLAEAKTHAVIGRTFVDHCIDLLRDGALDPTTAAMAKWWTTQAQNEIVDDCVQLHGGYGYMVDFPVARMWIDSRAQRIYGGANEIMKTVIARTL
jgi:acyl-CoA dehydrogenase